MAYLKQEKTENELHYKLILKIEEEFNDEDFRKVKQLFKSHIPPRTMQRIDNFSDLVDELAKKGLLVSWENGGYSKLKDVLEDPFPAVLKIIKEYEDKIKKASELPGKSSFAHEQLERNTSGQMLGSSVSPDITHNTPDDVKFGFSNRNEYYMSEVRQTILTFGLDNFQRGTVTAAVLDSGIQVTHQAFNSFKDDIDVIDYLGENVMPDDPSHGTACAAILAADQFDSFDGSEKVVSSGAAPFVELTVGKVIPKMIPGQEKEYKNAFAEALIKALNSLNEREHPINIISMSLGTPRDTFTYDQLSALKCAMNRACERSIVVCSPSNEGQRDANTVLYPAQFGGIIVGSCDIMGNRSSYSGVGRQLDFLAYGENLWVPNVVNAFDSHSKAQMTEFTGTSAAAPVVAGIAAQVLALAQKWGNERKHGLGNELKKRLTQTSMMREALKLMSATPCSHDAKQGHGMLSPKKVFKEKEIFIRQLLKIAMIQEETFES